MVARKFEIVRHRGKKMRLVWESVALVALLASTWLVVGASLQEASTAIVSAGRTSFTVLGLFALTWWLTHRDDSGPTRDHPIKSHSPRYRWWQILILAMTGVTAYTVLSTIAISLAGPALPTLVMSLTPAVVLAAEGLMSRMAPPTLTLVGTAAAVTGALIYVIPGLDGALGPDVGLGALFAVAAMLSMAFYGIYFAKVNRNYRGPMAPRILPVFVIGTIPLAIWASTDFIAGKTVTWMAVGMLAFLGIVIYVPAYLLQHRILLSAGPSYSALLGLVVPLLVGVSSALLRLAGISGPIQIAGMVLTLLGMIVVIRHKLEPAR